MYDYVTIKKICRGVEQGLARWAHNPKVGGSNPFPANFLFLAAQRVLSVQLFFLWRYSSVG